MRAHEYKQDLSANSLFNAELVAHYGSGIATYWLEVTVKNHHNLTSLTQSLAKIGYYRVQDEQGRDEFLDSPVLYFACTGSGLYGRWTKDEQQKFLPAIRKLFLSYGITLNSRKLSLKETIKHRSFLRAGI